MSTGIYRITCTVTEKVYIGSAVNIKIRMADHLSRLRKRTHKNSKLQRAWEKYGEHCFVFTTIEQCTKESLMSREQYWIDFYNAVKKGFNISPTAFSTIGVVRPVGVYKHSEETRLKISLGNTGKKRGVEQGERNRSIFQGKLLSDNHKQRISDVLKGRPKTDDHKAKISAANKGKKRPHARRVSKEYVAKKYKITDPNGNVYEAIGLPEFCKAHSLTRSTMSDLANGKIKQGHHKGWCCEFA